MTQITIKELRSLIREAIEENLNEDYGTSGQRRVGYVAGGYPYSKGGASMPSQPSSSVSSEESATEASGSVADALKKQAAKSKKKFAKTANDFGKFSTIFYKLMVQGKIEDTDAKILNDNIADVIALLTDFASNKELAAAGSAIKPRSSAASGVWGKFKSAFGLTESQQRIVEKMIREEIAKVEKENSRNRGTKAKKG